MASRALPQGDTGGLGRMMKHADVFMAVAVVMVVAMMIIPLPQAALDVFITINISVGLIILLITMYTREPLQFSVFPSLLLVATLFRLGLNVSATRLILLHGDAGQVISAFGNFVIGGNYVVGVVVFLILVVIQFVVITNGAGRVAEVAARFTLDAMPGKQMSIDADLNAGLIAEDEARRRRRTIENEADFYGAMDGASKFVKGDAIAGIIIIMINIIGGLAIGVLQRGVDISQAVQTYTLLTVGDGLVSQIPALLISTATGIIVTRAASDSNLGRDVASQILTNPRVLIIVSAVLFGFGLVPGLPKIPFFIIGIVLGGLSFALNKSRKAEELAAAEPEAPAEEGTWEPEAVTALLQVEPMELEIGYGLIPLVDASQGGNLLSRIGLIRRQVALDLGIILPTIRIRDNLQLGPNQYSIKLRGVQIALGEVRVERYLAMNPGTAGDELDGIQTVEPAFGLPALWIGSPDKERAEMLGYTVVDPASVLTTHLTEVIRSNASAMLSRQDVRTLLDNLKADYPAVVEELVPDLLGLGEVQKVLQNLLRERVSIRDLVTILEALASAARSTRDTDMLTEAARQALARSITSQNVDGDGALHVVTLNPSLQDSLAKSLVATDQGTVVNMDPAVLQRLVKRLAEAMERMASEGHAGVLLCAARIRLPLKRLLDRALPSLVLLSYAEVAQQTDVRSHGMVGVDDEG